MNGKCMSHAISISVETEVLGVETLIDEWKMAL